MQITISQLKKAFNDNMAVNIDSLHVNDGEIIGLVGNNGAGKTTMFRLMLDLLKADNGYVELTFCTNANGQTQGTGDAADTITVNPAKMEDWKQYTGAYIDDSFLIDFLLPEEYFEFIAKVCGIDNDTMRQRLDEMERFMGGEIMGKKKLIRDYSAGNKQKIGIVAAMLNHPQLLILDEPFNFLDPSSQNILKQMLTHYNQTTGATVLLSSHNLQHTVDVSSRIVLLEHGVVVKDLANSNGCADKELEHYFMVGATEEQHEEETEGKAEEGTEGKTEEETKGKAEEKQEGQADGKAEERTEEKAEEQAEGKNHSYRFGPKR